MKFTQRKDFDGEFEQVGVSHVCTPIQLQIGVDPLNGTYAEIENIDDEKKASRQ